MAKTKMKKSKAKKWSAHVTKNSRALALEAGVFTWDSPKRIARSLARSARRSKAPKAAPFQSAMSMLNFYINRAGKNMPVSRKKMLTEAKVELRREFGKQES